MKKEENMDKNYYNDIYDQHINEVYRFVFLRTNSQEASQDICSDVFFKFYNSTKNKPAKYLKNPRAFIYKIARNKVIDYYRTNKKNLSFDELKEDSTMDEALIDNSFEEKLHQEDLKQVIQRGLQQIKPLYADIIIYKFVEELSNQEISNILSKTESNVRVLIHRSLKALKDKIKF